MAELCGQCLSLDWNNQERYTSYERYYCNEMHRYVEPTDRSCRYYKEDKSKTQKSSNGYTPSGCSFSIIVRDILGYPDNCEMLNLLRNFRENILKKNPQLISLLVEYDTFSPAISENIFRSEDKINYSLRLMQNFLIPFSIAMKSGKYNEATSIYQNLWNTLKEKFNLTSMTIDLNMTYDLENLGKARIRQPKTSAI